MGGLRCRGPVTCGFAGSRPAPSRRPRAVPSCLGGSATPRPSAGVQDRQVDGSSVRARAHLPSPRPHASFSAGRARLRHPTRAFIRGHPWHSPGAPAPIARRPSARPASRLLRALLAMRCPGSGPSVRPSARAWDGRAGAVAGLRSLARADCRWRDYPRLRSLLAANQWIAKTSAVVEPILRHASPRSLPIESLRVPEAKARPISSRARKRGVSANAGGIGWGQWLATSGI